MRFIDPDTLDIPDGWFDATAETRRALSEAAGDADELKKLLLRAARLWSRIRPALVHLSFGKCWYCESLERRSDLNVDHFRPKSRVREAPQHPGYWWLALDVTNFRLSCQFCNQHRLGIDGGSGGGKSDHFPIRQEETRACGPMDNIDLEQPSLLDPTDALDTVLLTFGYDGKAAANREKCPPGSFEATRVAASLELYHLNHAGIVEARKMLNRSLMRNFDDAVRLLPQDQTVPAIRHATKNAVENLKRAISERSELSSTARALVRSRRASGGVDEMVVQMLLDH